MESLAPPVSWMAVAVAVAAAVVYASIVASAVTVLDRFLGSVLVLGAAAMAVTAVVAAAAVSGFL